MRDFRVRVDLAASCVVEVRADCETSAVNAALAKLAETGLDTNSVSGLRATSAQVLPADAPDLPTEQTLDADYLP